MHFLLQNVALGLSIQQSIFNFLKMFGLLPGSLLSSFSDSNTCTLSSGWFILKTEQMKSCSFALILSEYDTLSFVQNTLEHSWKILTHISSCLRLNKNRLYVHICLILVCHTLLEKNMRNKENIFHIVRNKLAITSLSLTSKVSAFC